MPSARVKTFDTERSFGFAQPIEGGRDVYVHASEVVDTDELRPGDVIEYEEAETEEGIQATQVRVTERAPEENPAGRVVVGGPPPTWDKLEEIDRQLRQDRRQRRRRR